MRVQKICASGIVGGVLEMKVCAGAQISRNGSLTHMPESASLKWLAERADNQDFVRQLKRRTSVCPQIKYKGGIPRQTSSSPGGVDGLLRTCKALWAVTCWQRFWAARQQQQLGQRQQRFRGCAGIRSVYNKIHKQKPFALLRGGWRA